MTAAECWKETYLKSRESGRGFSSIEELPSLSLSFFRICNHSPFKEYEGVWLFPDDSGVGITFKEVQNGVPKIDPEDFLPDDPSVLLLAPGVWNLPRK